MEEGRRPDILVALVFDSAKGAMTVIGVDVDTEFAVESGESGSSTSMVLSWRVVALHHCSHTVVFHDEGVLHLGSQRDFVCTRSLLLRRFFCEYRPLYV